MLDRRSEDAIGARLSIWSNALEYCEDLLQFAVKAQHATGPQAEREWLMRPDVLLKAKELEDADTEERIPGIRKLSHIVDAENALLPPFGSLKDMHMAIESSRLLAIVVFSQIFNSGYEEAGHVATNSDRFRKEHMPAIEVIAFPNAEDFDKYQLLKVALKDARDNMIAHANGAAYRTSMDALPDRLMLWQVGNALDGIELGFFRRAVVSMARAARQYQRQRAS